MPDMQTALSKVISSWEQEVDAANAPQVTTGVSQATHQYVKDNPGMTKSEAIKELEKLGYKPSSTTTLLSAMIRNKQITLSVNGGMYIANEHYTPIRTQVKKAEEKSAPKPKVTQMPAEQAQGIAALSIPTTQATPTRLTAKQVLETLNVQEAYELYKELDKMFN
jgi:uncharacterized protein YigE (DUF2233 family)